MGLGEVILAVECDEPDGKIVRHVRKVPLTLERFRKYHEKLTQFDTLFNDYIGDSFEAFVRCFVGQDASGELHAKGLLWEVDDVGILYLTDIAPGAEAQAHFTFWDQRFRGREKLLREMCKYVIENFHFHRLFAEVPLYARPTLELVERIGFKKEGRMRDAVKYKGDWFDVNLYSLLEQEVRDGDENREDPTGESSDTVRAGLSGAPSGVAS